MVRYSLVIKNRLPSLNVILDDKLDRFIFNSSDVYQIMKEEGVCNLPEEYLYLFCINLRNRIIGFFEVSHGDVEQTVASIPQILVRALLTGATRIIMVHNHPSGDISPSSFDALFTAELKNACSILKIEFLDHVIVTDSNYCSYKDSMWEV